MPRKPKKLNPYAREIIIQAKVNSTELREVFKRASVHTKGNVSALIRLMVLGKNEKTPK